MFAKLCFTGRRRVVDAVVSTLRRVRVVVRALAACSLVLVGCDALNPAFVNLLNPSGSAGIPTLENAPGHVIVSVINSAEVDERLLDFLETRLDLTEAEKQSLRPRIRMRVRITFVDGSQQVVEFVTGSQGLIDPAFQAQAFPDLNQNDLNNVVALCDVARVEVDPASAIEVFIPVQLNAYELVESEMEGGVVQRSFELREQIPPQFRVLAVDQVDEDGNVTLRRNIGVRDVPSPVADLPCGINVAIVISGVLAVPFLENVDPAPSFDRDDEATVGSIGGRYEFRVSVQ